MANIEELFGSSVFNDAVMQKRLPKDIYKALHKTITDGTPLDPQVANVVANAMKDWAVERGATHYHALVPAPDRHHRGKARQLHHRPGRRQALSWNSPARSSIQRRAGRFLASPPAACAPRLRRAATPRGIPPAYAFIKDGALCIPTAFCSYGGEALDKKTPLLRSMEALINAGSSRAEALRRHRRNARDHHRRPGAGVFPCRQGALRPAQGPDLHRPHAVRRTSRRRGRSWKTTISARSSRAWQRS